MKITYKKEGDGFQCDCICDDGYTFTFYFRNQPAPKRWLDQGLSPLHARCMALFDCLMEEYHLVRFDNLYMSAKFALALFQRPKKVLVEGVTRTNQRGLPKEIIQHEIKSSSKKELAKVKGTVVCYCFVSTSEEGSGRGRDTHEPARAGFEHCLIPKIGIRQC